MSGGMHLTGGAWIGAGAWGTLRSGVKPAFLAGMGVPLPPADGVFPKPMARWGRFDEFVRLGCLASALALKDAGAAFPLGADFGMVVGSRHESERTDGAFWATTLDEGGSLASPNLFSYTLPVIVLGECAVCFGLSGPTFCVGEEGGHGAVALGEAGRLMRAGKADRMLAGWIDSAPGPDASGALFVVLEKEASAGASAGLLAPSGAGFTFRPTRGGAARDVVSLVDLF